MIRLRQRVDNILTSIDNHIELNLGPVYMCNAYGRIQYLKSKLPQTAYECIHNDFTKETATNIHDVLDFILEYGEYFDGTYIIDLLQILSLNWEIKCTDGYFHGIDRMNRKMPKVETYGEALFKIVKEHEKFWRAVQC